MSLPNHLRIKGKRFQMYWSNANDMYSSKTLRQQCMHIHRHIPKQLLKLSGNFYAFDDEQEEDIDVNIIPLIADIRDEVKSISFKPFDIIFYVDKLYPTMMPNFSEITLYPLFYIDGIINGEYPDTYIEF